MSTLQNSHVNGVEPISQVYQTRTTETAMDPTLLAASIPLPAPPSPSKTLSNVPPVSPGQQLTLPQVLDDLVTRFIINVPDEELNTMARICFQIEAAHWFYEDFYREQDSSLPSFSLKNFIKRLERHFPALLKHIQVPDGEEGYGDGQSRRANHEKAFADFMEYKSRVPTCGAIMLSSDMKKCLLVRGWGSKTNWTFPRGKINASERERDCAVREVEEETGYNIAKHLVYPVGKKGRMDVDGDDTELTTDDDLGKASHQQEPLYLEHVDKNDRVQRMYISICIPLDTKFETRTRKEIGGIEWHDISTMLEKMRNKAGSGRPDVSGGPKYYQVYPFISRLKRWMDRNKRKIYSYEGKWFVGGNPPPGAERWSQRRDRKVAGQREDGEGYVESLLGRNGEDGHHTDIESTTPRQTLHLSQYAMPSTNGHVQNARLSPRFGQVVHTHNTNPFSSPQAQVGHLLPNGLLQTQPVNGVMIPPHPHSYPNTAAMAKHEYSYEVQHGDLTWSYSMRQTATLNTPNRQRPQTNGFPPMNHVNGVNGIPHTNTIPPAHQIPQAALFPTQPPLAAIPPPPTRNLNSSERVISYQPTDYNVSAPAMSQFALDVPRLEELLRDVLAIPSEC